jgi:hypothetical protein
MIYRKMAVIFLAPSRRARRQFAGCERHRRIDRAFSRIVVDGPEDRSERRPLPAPFWVHRRTVPTSTGADGSDPFWHGWCGIPAHDPLIRLRRVKQRIFDLPQIQTARRCVARRAGSWASGAPRARARRASHPMCQRGVMLEDLPRWIYWPRCHTRLPSPYDFSRGVGHVEKITARLGGPLRGTGRPALARASDISGQWCERFSFWQTGQRTAVAAKTTLTQHRARLDKTLMPG